MITKRIFITQLFYTLAYAFSFFNVHLSAVLAVLVQLNFAVGLISKMPKVKK